jgi:hypothetical protein
MMLPEIITGIQSDNVEVQFQATQSCRRMLSRERKPPIDDVISAGLLPRLVDFLARFDRSSLLNVLHGVFVTILVSDESAEVGIFQRSVIKRYQLLVQLFHVFVLGIGYFTIISIF